MASEGQGRIKGAPVRALLDYWAEAHGPGAIAELRERLPRDAARQLALDPHRPGFGVLAGGWYDNSAAGALLEDLLGRVPVGERPALMDAIAYEVMQRTLNGVHKAVFRIVGSPELMRKKGQFFWNQQFDTGEVEIEAVDERHQIHHYRQWTGHHRLLCKLSFCCVRPMFHMMGVSSCVVEPVSCVSHGGGECVAHVRWDG